MSDTPRRDRVPPDERPPRLWPSPEWSEDGRDGAADGLRWPRADASVGPGDDTPGQPAGRGRAPGRRRLAAAGLLVVGALAWVSVGPPAGEPEMGRTPSPPAPRVVGTPPPDALEPPERRSPPRRESGALDTAGRSGAGEAERPGDPTPRRGEGAPPAASSEVARGSVVTPSTPAATPVAPSSSPSALAVEFGP